jgi:hypothetical protein
MTFEAHLSFLGMTTSSMADPLSVSTNVAGLLSQTLELSTILHNYVTSVQSAPEDAQHLLMEIVALGHVLKELVGFLRNKANQERVNPVNKTSVLCSVIQICQSHIEKLYKLCTKFSGAQSRMTHLVERIKWPLKKDNCEQATTALHRFTQTFQFSLVISNRLVINYILQLINIRTNNLQFPVHFFPKVQWKC